MRKTLTLTLDTEMAEFINNQPEMIDPSEYFNCLFHEDMKKKGFQVHKDTKHAIQDDVIKELELSVDRDLPPAG